MNLIRSIKISKLGVAIPEKELEIIDFVKSMLSDLIPFHDNSFPKSIFYFKGDKWLLEQDNKNDSLWVRYDIFWDVLEDKYSISYSDVQTLLKYMIEQAFKEKVSTPKSIYTTNNPKIEQAFKEKVSTPIKHYIKSNPVIEQAFKEKVSTFSDNIEQGHGKIIQVEEAFKENVSTPDKLNHIANITVEQAYNKKKL